MRAAVITFSEDQLQELRSRRNQAAAVCSKMEAEVTREATCMSACRPRGLASSNLLRRTLGTDWAPVLLEKPSAIPFDFHSLTPVQVGLEMAELSTLF